jgi:predicted cupin superfamily sugar epimerase
LEKLLGTINRDRDESAMNAQARTWIEKLNLVKHPEGGYYVRTYFSREWIEREHLPQRFAGSRPFSTAIYYLLPGDEFSAFHRIHSDEMWHFYAGSTLTLHILEGEGRVTEKKLGRDFERGERFQHLVEAGCWFGATVEDEASYSLLGCTVSPGFAYEDFEIADRENLLAQYPDHRKLIISLTRTR